MGDTVPGRDGPPGPHHPAGHGVHWVVAVLAACGVLERPKAQGPSGTAGPPTPPPPQVSHFREGNKVNGKRAAAVLKDGAKLCPDSQLGRCCSSTKCTKGPHKCAVIVRAQRACGSPGHGAFDAGPYVWTECSADRCILVLWLAGRTDRHPAQSCAGLSMSEFQDELRPSIDQACLLVAALDCSTKSTAATNTLWGCQASVSKISAACRRTIVLASSFLMNNREDARPWGRGDPREPQ